VAQSERGDLSQPVQIFERLEHGRPSWRMPSGRRRRAKDRRPSEALQAASGH
jgi:hypothetical protein